MGFRRLGKDNPGQNIGIHAGQPQRLERKPVIGALAGPVAPHEDPRQLAPRPSLRTDRLSRLRILQNQTPGLIYLIYDLQAGKIIAPASDNNSGCSYAKYRSEVVWFFWTAPIVNI